MDINLVGFKSQLECRLIKTQSDNFGFFDFQWHKTYLDQKKQAQNQATNDLLPNQSIYIIVSPAILNRRI